MKAKAIQGLAQTLVDQHGGEVPADMAALTALPGVGRKTANVVLGHALGVPGFPVDRHVLRVANRLGIAQAATPEQVETPALCGAAVGPLDRVLGHPHPARPPHLPPAAALRSLRRPWRSVRSRPEWARPASPAAHGADPAARPRGRPAAD